MKDFLGGKDPEAWFDEFESLSTFGTLLKAASDGDEEFFGGGRSEIYFLKSAIIMAACLTRTKGYVSKKMATEDIDNRKTATSILVRTYLKLGKKMFESDRGFDAKEAALFVSNEADIEMAEKAIAYGKALEGSSEFDNNIRVLAHSEELDGKYFGMACAMVGMYQRSVLKAIEAEEKLQQWVQEYMGIENAGPQNFILRVISQTTRPGEFGVSYIYNFKDEKGREATYFSSKDLQLINGSTYEIRASVKKHGFKHGSYKCTYLTRGKKIREVVSSISSQNTSSCSH